MTASRGAPSVGEASADVTVLDRARLDATAAPALDDVLREVAGFALFRRAGSRVANPTAQGVSLRGTGGSGASRALVLWDGLPLVDPFGGWVAWARVPLVSLERVEVVEGGVSSLYGSGALGGVVQALTRRDAPALAVELAGGDAGQASGAFFASARRGRSLWRAAGEARAFGGYVLVAEDARGAVDTEAGARHLTGSAAWELRPSAASRLTLTASAFGESRKNGTPLQTNDTSLRALAAAWTASGARIGTLDASGWWQSQTYHQAFSAVAPGRASETLIRRQRVPSDAIGLGLVWSRAAGRRTVWSAGADARRTDGRSDETPFVASRPGALVSSGGRETVAAAFARAQFAATDRLTLAAGARFDRWRSGERADRRLSPQLGASFRATGRLQVTAGTYGAFRAPTLNERYRSFRVGDTLTLAEPDLSAERLAGAELGLAWAGGRIRARTTLFAARIDDPVVSRTLARRARARHAPARQPRAHVHARRVARPRGTARPARPVRGLHRTRRDAWTRSRRTRRSSAARCRRSRATRPCSPRRRAPRGCCAWACSCAAARNSSRTTGTRSPLRGLRHRGRARVTAVRRR